MASQKENTSTVESLIRHYADRFNEAGLSYGHGTDNAVDEDDWLVFAHLGLSHDDVPEVYARPVTHDAHVELEEMAERRIREKVPVAYLVNQAFFAGLVRPRSFGAPRVSDLLVPGEAGALADELAYWFASQYGERVAREGSTSRNAR